MTDDNHAEHTEVHICNCGETFADKERLETHVKRTKIDEFNDYAEEYIREHFGDPFLSYFQDIRRDMGGIAAYQTAKETGHRDDRDEIPTEPVERVNAKKAAREWMRGALIAPNCDRLTEYDGGQQ